MVEEGSAITHTASTPTFTLGESGIYLISYSAVASNTTSTGTVGVELENNSTPVPGSESQATIATTSNVANLGGHGAGKCDRNGYHYTGLYRKQCDPD